jgi:pyruvate dehydrogenase E1 component
MSAQHWEMSPTGQHIELGIAENNLFLLLGTLGLSHSRHWSPCRYLGRST